MVDHAARHPARFTPSILDAIAPFVPVGARVLDPFAGTGRVHDLPFDTYGTELEPEWAALHPDTIVGNALHLPFHTGSFDAVVTSPCYGNRFADHHKARDGSHRRSYTHDIGRPLHPDNAGQLHWGLAYRGFHTAAWLEVARVLQSGGVFVLNVSNHIRRGIEQPVAEWHARTLQGLGFERRQQIGVSTPRMRHGQNGSLRVNVEWVLVFEAGGPGG